MLGRCFRFALLLALLCAVPALAADRARCRYVIDGDTFYAEGIGKVRLLGVDAPEVGHGKGPDEPGGREAKNFLKQRLAGKWVSLDYDETRRDKYGRTLAYVTTEDGAVINEELLRRGLAEPIRHFPYKMKAKYLKIQRAGTYGAVK